MIACNIRSFQKALAQQQIKKNLGGCLFKNLKEMQKFIIGGAKPSREQVIDCFICIYIFGMRHHSPGGGGGSRLGGAGGSVQIVQGGALHENLLVK
jgi:hypothetical protein